MGNTSDVNIRLDFVEKFLVYYGGKPRGRFSNSYLVGVLNFSC